MLATMADVDESPAGAANAEAYESGADNPFRRVAQEPLSTFSIDVDTASYANVRRFLNRGTLPPADAVRIEEMINYFHFDYANPRDGRPLSVTTELAPCPWNDRHALALIGLQTRRVDMERTPPRNLVFLLDVSGSMNEPDKLPLVKTAMAKWDSRTCRIATARNRAASNAVTAPPIRRPAAYTTTTVSVPASATVARADTTISVKLSAGSRPSTRRTAAARP